MRVSAIFFPVAFLASFVAASPVVEERGTGLTATGGKGVEAWSPAEPHVHASPAVIANGAQTGGHTAAAPISKRSEHNTLAERAGAQIFLCTAPNCTGNCYAYSLAVPPYQCYGTIGFQSIYVSNGGVGLPYGVYVGYNCNGVLIPYTDTCFNISPYGNTFFIN